MLLILRMNAIDESYSSTVYAGFFFHLSINNYFRFRVINIYTYAYFQNLLIVRNLMIF